MIRQSGGHGRGTRIAKLLRLAPFVMREAEGVSASNHVHSGLQPLKALSRMSTCAGESSQAFPPGATRAFHQGRIEWLASDRHVQQVLCLLKGSQRQLP